MIQEHADALIGPLRAYPGLVVYPVANGQPGSGGYNVPPGAEPPYVSVHISFGRRLGPDPDSPTLDMRSGRIVAHAFCHCVGDDDIAARAVAQQVDAALIDVRPVIAGRTCYPVRFDSAAPPLQSGGTGRQVSELTVVYRLESVPGPA